MHRQGSVQTAEQVIATETVDAASHAIANFVREWYVCIPSADELCPCILHVLSLALLLSSAGLPPQLNGGGGFQIGR